MNQPAPYYREHNTAMEWGITTFEYREDGIQITVPDIPAWICPKGGEASFTPETTDHLIATLRTLAAAAKQVRECSPSFRECRVLMV